MEKQAHAEESLLGVAAPYLQLIALLGIPAAGSGAVLFLLQIPRFISGHANPFLFVFEAGSLMSVVVLVVVLRACLKLPSAPVGFYRDILDFLAVARWHTAVKVALAGLLILPILWFYHANGFWFLSIFKILGRNAFRSGDVQDGMDTVAVIFQQALVCGVPFLFALHMLSRWKPKNRVLPWILIPLLFVGTAVAIILMVAIMHS